ncbi:hypothetical protein K2173_021926 [Erythroxylum novogranatense]|uniref:Uncharacterized protein n=1 Tax=Erythroxylum novogranatense TaxID=1862640 RepID=A0AAV8T2W0_9ROSI|nr:hypothetical protein K2173_021926 [Erythroxylum novogranatense]
MFYLQDSDRYENTEGLSKEELGRLVTSRWVGTTEKKNDEINSVEHDYPEDHEDHEDMPEDKHEDDGYTLETDDDTGKYDDIDAKDDTGETYEKDVHDDTSPSYKHDFNDAAYRAIVFSNGDKCWNGPDKSLKELEGKLESMNKEELKGHDEL